jgi:hypothetical protein
MLQAAPSTEPAAEIAAWWRLVELCLPSHEQSGAITFAPAGTETLEADWGRWLTDLYLPVLHPTLTALQSAAARQDVASLRAEDAALGVALPAAAAAGSLVAGRHLVLSFTPPQGAKLLERWRDALAADSTAGHLATGFVIRGQIFHLPARPLAGALLLAECVLGADAAGVTLPAGRTASLLRQAFDRVAAAPAVELMAV